MTTSSDSNESSPQKKQKIKVCSTEFTTYYKLIAKPRNLIEFKSKFIVHGLYSHWAVYIGDNEVIHLGISKERGIEIRTEKFEEVAKGDKCRINNLEKAAKKLDPNLELKSKLEVEQNAFKFLNEFKKRSFKYSVTDFNCEHFVTLCAYGKPFSERTDNVMDKTFFHDISPSIDLTSEVIHTKATNNEN